MLATPPPRPGGRTPVGSRAVRPAVWLVVAAALALAGVEIVLLYSGGPLDPPWQVLLFPAVAAAYLGAGAVSWIRRPSNRIGLLLSVGALVWLASGMTNVQPPVLVALGEVTATLGLAIVVHLLHAFPSGKLRSRLSRWTVAAGYGVTLVLQVPQWLWAPGPLEVASRPDLVSAGRWIQLSAGMIVMVVTAITLGRRLVGLAGGQRPLLGVLYAYGIGAVLFVPAATLHWVFPWDPIVRAEVQLLALGGIPVAFVVAMLFGGFGRTSELAELGAWLGEEEENRPSLTDVLADVLGDPSVDLAFWIPAAGRFVDQDGHPVELPAPGSDRDAVEVTRGQTRIGAIVYDATLIADPSLVRAAARVIALALEREHLTAGLRASRDELRASRARLVEAAEDERRRLARDLHDGLQTRLVVLAMNADRIRARTAGDDRAAGDAGELHAGQQLAIDELRDLVHGVMPAVLTERGLYAAIAELVQSVPIPARLEFDEEPAPLSAPVESAGYFLVSEALSNAVKHSDAGELQLRLGRHNGTLTIEVADDGIGGALASSGAGLRGIADRIEALDGRLHLDSPPGGGTRLVAELPCAS